MTEMYQRIAEQCQKHNINGTQLALLLGLKKSPMTDWKNNKSNPTVEQLAKMCEIFAVSADYLIFGYRQLLTGSKEVFDTSRGTSELINLYEQLTDYDKCEILEFVQLKLRLRSLRNISV